MENEWMAFKILQKNKLVFEADSFQILFSFLFHLFSISNCLLKGWQEDRRKVQDSAQIRQAGSNRHRKVILNKKSIFLWTFKKCRDAVSIS